MGLLAAPPFPLPLFTKHREEAGRSAHPTSHYNPLHTGAMEKEDRVDAPSGDGEVLQRYVEAFERKDWEAATAF